MAIKFRHAVVAALMISAATPAMAADSGDTAIYMNLLAYIKTSLSVAGAEMSAFEALGLDPKSKVYTDLQSAFSSQASAELALATSLQNNISAS